MTVVALRGGELVGELSGASVAAPRPPAILALHGWGRTRADFRPLAARWPGTLALDLPGFGSSPSPAAAIGAAGYAELVAEALGEVAAGEPVVVVGHSFGGRVGVCLAARRPDLVRALVVIGTPLLRGPASRPSLRFRVARALHRAHLVSDRRMNALRERLGSADYRAASGVMRAVLVKVVNEDYRDELAALRCPTALLWGAEDGAAPLAVARRAAESVTPLVELRTVAGAGHDVHLSHGEVLDEVLGAVMRAADGEPTRTGVDR